jgi:DNA topoisomerase VI, subunit A
MPPKAKKAAKTSKGSTASASNKVRTGSTQSGTKRRIVELAQDADAVLSKCRKLREELKRNSDSDQRMQKKSAGGLMKANLKMEQDNDDEVIAVVSNNDNNSNNVIESLQGKSIIEVSEMSPVEVVEAIELIAVQIANQVLQKKGFALEIPSRSASNQIYVPELDRIVLGEKRGTRSFLNVKVSLIL